ncbi:MAG TPA: PIN domain-containing protein [Gemmatimonadota bacterium]|nr:PIN domain-containing protein [Gemmatimonadota bacterium]
MALEVVLDTGVFVAGLRSSRGASFQILRRIGTGQFDIDLSVPLVLEYEEVLKREAHAIGLTLAEIDDVLDYVCGVGRHREIFFLWRPILKDAFDDHLMEVAVAGECQYVVTHNLGDFSGCASFGIHAITPGDFLRILQQGESKR